MGKSRNYVTNWLNRHKDELPEDMLLSGENAKLISESGVEWIKKHTKKGDARKNNSVFFRVQRQNDSLTPAPKYNFTGSIKPLKGGNCYEES